jgi:F-type H+-transporting ATPase subunit b
MDNKQILSEIIVQILGFLAVFAILKHFAWSKLLGAIDTRRKTIEDSFLDVEKKKKEIEELEKEYRQRLDRIEETARVKIQEASQAGMVLAKDIQEKARLDSQKLIERAKGEIRQDLEKARAGMRNEIVEISTLITEKVLKEKLSAADHKKLVDEFIKEMEKV